jgi:hypothetical protein
VKSATTGGRKSPIFNGKPAEPEGASVTESSFMGARNISNVSGERSF